MSENGSLLGRIVKWTIIAVLAVIAFRIAVRLAAFVIGLAGMALGLAMFVLFTVGPLVLLGWLTVKAWRAFAKERPAV